MVSLHYFRRLCSLGRVMPEVYLRYLHLLTNSSIPNRTGGLLTLLSRPVGTSESRCDSFFESWSVYKGPSGASLRTVLLSLLLFSESSPGIVSYAVNCGKAWRSKFSSHAVFSVSDSESCCTISGMVLNVTLGLFLAACDSVVVVSITWNGLSSFSSSVSTSFGFSS